MSNNIPGNNGNDASNECVLTNKRGCARCNTVDFASVHEVITYVHILFKPKALRSH